MRFCIALHALLHAYTLTPACTCKPLAPGCLLVEDFAESFSVTIILLSSVIFPHRRSASVWVFFIVLFFCCRCTSTLVFLCTSFSSFSHLSHMRCFPTDTKLPMPYKYGFGGGCKCFIRRPVSRYVAVTQK